jgi:hypothetical protein
LPCEFHPSIKSAPTSLEWGLRLVLQNLYPERPDMLAPGDE